MEAVPRTPSGWVFRDPPDREASAGGTEANPFFLCSALHEMNVARRREERECGWTVWLLGLLFARVAA